MPWESCLMRGRSGWGLRSSPRLGASFKVGTDLGPKQLVYACAKLWAAGHKRAVRQMRHGGAPSPARPPRGSTSSATPPGGARSSPPAQQGRATNRFPPEIHYQAADLRSQKQALLLQLDELQKQGVRGTSIKRVRLCFANSHKSSLPSLDTRHILRLAGMAQLQHAEVELTRSTAKLCVLYREEYCLPERLSVASSPKDLARALPKLTRSYDKLSESLKDFNAEQRSFFATLLMRAMKQKLKLDVIIMQPLEPMPPLRSREALSSSKPPPAPGEAALSPQMQSSASITPQADSEEPKATSCAHALRRKLTLASMAAASNTLDVLSCAADVKYQKLEDGDESCLPTDHAKLNNAEHQGRPAADEPQDKLPEAYHVAFAHGLQGFMVFSATAQIHALFGGWSAGGSSHAIANVLNFFCATVQLLDVGSTLTRETLGIPCDCFRGAQTRAWETARLKVVANRTWEQWWEEKAFGAVLSFATKHGLDISSSQFVAFANACSMTVKAAAVAFVVALVLYEASLAMSAVLLATVLSALFVILISLPLRSAEVDAVQPVDCLTKSMKQTARVFMDIGSAVRQSPIKVGVAIISLALLLDGLAAGSSHGRLKASFDLVGEVAAAAATMAASSQYVRQRVRPKEAAATQQEEEVRQARKKAYESSIVTHLSGMRTITTDSRRAQLMELERQKNERNFNRLYEEARQATREERARRQAAEDSKAKSQEAFDRDTTLTRISMVYQLVDEASADVALDSIKVLRSQQLASLEKIITGGLPMACLDVAQAALDQVEQGRREEAETEGEIIMLEVLNKLAQVVAEEASSQVSEEKRLYREELDQKKIEREQKAAEQKVAERAAREELQARQTKEFEAKREMLQEKARLEVEEQKRQEAEAKALVEAERARVEAEEADKLRLEMEAHAVIEVEVIYEEVRAAAEEAKTAKEQADRVEAERLAAETLAEELRSTGYAIGDDAFHVLPLPIALANGRRVLYGDRGEVLGLPTAEALRGGKGVAVRFGVDLKTDLNRPIDTLSPDQPPPLPSGYKPGDTIFFTGRNFSVVNDGQVVHGARGEILGPVAGDADGSLTVIFKDIKSPITIHLEPLSVAPPPPLPGGFLAGQSVYFNGHTQKLANDERILYGTQGEVIGPAVAGNLPRKSGSGVAVRFQGFAEHSDVPIALLSQHKLKLLGPFPPGATVFYSGFFKTIVEPFMMVDGDYLAHGAQGEVVGPATGHLASTCVAVRWESVKCGAIDTELTMMLSNSLPPLPGGLVSGTLVFYKGPSRTLPGTQITLEHGERGMVIGPQATKTTYSQAADKVAVRFDRGTGGDHIDMYVTALKSDGRPPPKPREIKGASGDSFKRSGRIPKSNKGPAAQTH